MSAVNPTDPRVVAGAAVAESILVTAGGPLGLVASQVLAGGLAFWADYAGKLAGGVLTADDVRMAASLADNDLTKLGNDIANAMNAAKLGFQPVQTPGVAQNAVINAQGIQSVGTKAP